MIIMIIINNNNANLPESAARETSAVSISVVGLR
jgi:hypothetical protein